MKFADYHNKAFAGIFEGENIAGDTYRIHMNSWWNGEGIDIHLETKDKKVQLLTVTDNEITAIAALAIAAGYIDPTELGVLSQMIETDHKERNKRFDTNS